MKSWFKYLFYASLVFLVIALIRADYLVIPPIHEPVLLVISIALLFLGFTVNALSWPMILRGGRLEVDLAQGLVSHGLSIFSKYIPGKLWVIMGRAEYLAAARSFSRKDLATHSMDAQIISLWCSLLLGSGGLFLIGGLNVYGLSALLLFLALSLLIFTPYFHRFSSLVLGRILKKKVSIPRLKIRQVKGGILSYLLGWLLWGIAFALLASALGASGHSPGQIAGIALGFPLAASIGILSIFAPGGLGVREGILTAYLTMAGLDLPLATTISVSSRLWYLIGESFIFCLALLIRDHCSPRTGSK